MEQSSRITAANSPMDEINTIPSGQNPPDIELITLSEMPAPLEPEQPRSKFRLAAILTALYVNLTNLLPKIQWRLSTNRIPVSNVSHSSRPNHRSNCHSYHHLRLEQRLWLRLDWRGLYAFMRSLRSNLGQNFRYIWP